MGSSVSSLPWNKAQVQVPISVIPISEPIPEPTFTLFVDLPAELRLEIWRHASAEGTPRMLEIFRNLPQSHSSELYWQGRRPFTRRKIGPLHLACRESLSVVTTTYVHWEVQYPWSPRDSISIIPLHPKKDLLFLRNSTIQALCGISEKYPAQAQQTTKLALQLDPTSLGLLSVSDMMPVLLKTMEVFCNLEYFVVIRRVPDDTPIGCKGRVLLYGGARVFEWDAIHATVSALGEDRLSAIRKGWPEWKMPRMGGMESRRELSSISCGDFFYTGLFGPTEGPMLGAVSGSRKGI